MKLGEIYNVNGTHYTVIACNDVARIATVVPVEKRIMLKNIISQWNMKDFSNELTEKQ